MGSVRRRIRRPWRMSGVGWDWRSTGSMWFRDPDEYGREQLRDLTSNSMKAALFSHAIAASKNYCFTAYSSAKARVIYGPARVVTEVQGVLVLVFTSR
jgi:hypothetical protein